ncbi:unnamed protein product [Lota lota]
MAHRSDEIEMHVETKKYQSYSGNKTEEIVPDCTANSKRHLYLAYLSIGLLCVLQALLNITLRVSWNESRAPTETSFPNQTPGNICMCWQNTSCSCYYMSHSKKNWNDSRKACRERGSDLIVVNSKEEQDLFLSGFWLGLTDAEVEGTWKWVDGTPLTTAYWGHPQPDNNGPAPNKEEDCVENYGMDGWNDASCLADRYWICEKKLDVSIV